MALDLIGYFFIPTQKLALTLKLIRNKTSRTPHRHVQSTGVLVAAPR